MQVVQINPTISRIAIQGELSASAENTLMDAYSRASTPGTRAILLDFNNLTYMNSSGIGLLVTLLIRMNRLKQRLLCYGLNEHYRHIFTLTRLNDVIKVHLTEQEAIADASL